MKETIAMLMAAIMMLYLLATSALPLSVGITICAATEDNQYGGGAEGTEVPQLAPLNPAFGAYWDNPPDDFYGYIPPPVDLSHLNKIPVKKAQASASSLPSSYDWRDYGKVTPVKDQNPCGTCWDFGATTVLESAVLIGENVAYDFSEQSVALCVDRSWVYLYDDWDDPCNGGGWGWLASEVFIKKGSVLESCNPYIPIALCCDGSCVCDDCPPVKKVDGYRLATNDGSQIDVIKNAVYDHGPVTMVFYYTSSGKYSVEPWGTIYDYYPCYGGANHLVSIIGWDDAVPHPNPDHGGTGAWIVKNSWGTGWGNNGFFYLAYDSSCAEELAYLEYKDPVPGEELLYWDEAGHVNSVGWGDYSAWMASVFTANQDSDLTHVDFWTTSSNAQYEIYVWDGFFGTQLAHQTGTCQEYGYYSIPLSAPISRNAGQQFTVGVDMTTPGYGYPISVEEGIPGRVDPPIQSGVSFIRHTGSDPWENLADYDWNACLRARIVGEAPVALPDQVITDKWVCWPDNCTICYNVTNIGIGTAPAGHNTTLYVDGFETAQDKVPVELAPNASYIGCFNYAWTYTPDKDNITVCADKNETVTESDEENNCLTNIWKCGDVDGNSNINMADVGLLWPHVYYPAVYPINEWTGDVDGNGYITMADVGLLWPHVYYPDVYPLNCRCS
jgi:C1A family cysteine protease